MTSLTDLEVTNSSVVLCDLDAWTAENASGWRVLRGTQDEIGLALAAELVRKGTRRLDDFGGVAETFLCDGETYLATPRHTQGGAALFSFTPRKKLLNEGPGMARVTKASGYSLLVLTLQKHGKFGKVWVLAGALRHLGDAKLTYYEDTAEVIDELKATPEGARIAAVHVLAPQFAELSSRLADRVVTQEQYRDEVLP